MALFLKIMPTPGLEKPTGKQLRGRQGPDEVILPLTLLGHFFLWSQENYSN